MRPQGSELWYNVLRREKEYGDIVDVFRIIIKMNKEDRAPHRKAHLHGWHAGKQASFDVATGERLAGEMDPDDETMIRAWIKIHREELFANWKLLTEEGTYFKVEPLR